RRSGVFDDLGETKDEDDKLMVKDKLVRETVRLLRDKHKAHDDHYLQHMMQQWEHKISQPEHLKMSAATKETYLRLLEDQRLFLAGLNKKPDINDQLILDQIYQIDLEEERVRLL